MANKFLSAKQVPQGLISPSSIPSRVIRAPTHDWHVRARPFTLQPVMIAPVLPGETLQNLLMQARCVSDPVKNPLIGWWKEYYFYYVPLRYLQSQLDGGMQVGHPGDAPGRASIERMLLDLTQNMDAATFTSGAAKLEYYQYDANAETGDMVDWLQYCTDAVANYHFREEGDSPVAVGNLPVVAFAGTKWTDSVYAADEFTDQVIDQTPTADISVEALDGLYQTYLIMKSQTMTELTFEDYVATFGVKSGSIGNELAPKLILRHKAWSYPSNTIGTSGDDLGVPSSALSWSVSDRADKAMFFREPGFIVGFSVSRPKVYIKAQRTYASSLLANALAWLPAVAKENVETSLRKIAAAEGPLGTATFRAAKAYWVDLRDLFVHGDQFINVATSTTDINLVASVHASDQVNSLTKYPVTADLDGFFANASPLNTVREDGTATLRIKGTQVDHT